MMNENYEKTEDYKKILKSKLNEKRYHHSLCVADEAVKLAEICGADKEKAYLAGLLHDITKNSTEQEHLEIFKRFNVTLSDVEKSSIKLWHAISGSVYVKNILGIDDIDIISAIRYHTTAKADLTLLEKVIYLADFTSSDRDYYDVDIMRKYTYESLDKGLCYALSYTMKELTEKKVAIHPDTFEAYNQNIIKVMKNAI